MPRWITPKRVVPSITMEEMMKLSREQIMTALEEWNQAWDNHDLDGVMNLFHEDILSRL
jgi:ketosteroid isomerase-like protein